MPKKADPNLKTQAGAYSINRVSEGKTYKSRLESNKEWESKHPQDKILFRVPQGGKSIIDQYVRRKAAEEPDNPKYSSNNRPSINAMIVSLLKQEIGEDLENLYRQAQQPVHAPSDLSDTDRKDDSPLEQNGSIEDLLDFESKE